MNFPPRTALSGHVPQTLLEGREGGSSIRFPKPPKFKRLPTTRCIHDSECLTHAIRKTSPEVLERDLESPIEHGQSSGLRRPGTEATSGPELLPLERL